MPPVLGLTRVAGGGSFLCPRVGHRGFSHRLTGGYDLSGKHKQLGLVDPLPFRSVTLAQQLFQLALHALQQAILVLHHLQQLQDDLV